MSKITILVLNKSGLISEVLVRHFNEEELYKRCGFKKPTHFGAQYEYLVSYHSKQYLIGVYGKTEGKSNTENSYRFPAPLNTIGFHGSCALVCKELLPDETTQLVSLSLTMWHYIYQELTQESVEEITKPEEKIPEVPCEKTEIRKKTKPARVKKEKKNKSIHTSVPRMNSIELSFEEY